MKYPVHRGWFLLVCTSFHLILQQCEGVYENVSYTATPTAAYFSSPGYPTSYSDNLTLDITVQSSTDTEVLFLEFDDCQIEYANAKVPFCQVDKLTIYDGPFANSTVLYQDCCITLPPNIQSSGQYLFLRFISDTTITARGFKVKFYNNGTSSAGTGDVASANALYLALGIIAIILFVGIIATIVVCQKYFCNSNKKHRIDPVDRSTVSNSVFEKTGETIVESKRALTPPGSPVPPPKKWTLAGGMQIDDSMMGPKLQNKPDLLVFNRELPDGSCRANILPPVQETRQEIITENE